MKLSWSITAAFLSNQDGRWVLAKPLAKGDVAIALFNENDTGGSIGASAEALRLPRSAVRASNSARRSRRARPRGRGDWAGARFTCSERASGS